MKKIRLLTLVAITMTTLGACSSEFSSAREGVEDVASSSESLESSSSVQTASTEEAKKSYKIGDTVKVGDVTYLVNSIETAKTVGSEFLPETADGIYLIVNVTVTNNGSESLTVSDSFFNVIHNGSEYAADSGASMSVNEGSEGFWYDSINPGLSKSGKVAFDVTETVATGPGTQLQVQTGYWGTETEVITLN